MKRRVRDGQKIADLGGRTLDLLLTRQTPYHLAKPAMRVH